MDRRRDLLHVRARPQSVQDGWQSEPALALVRAVYPRYYSGGAISGAVALASFVAGPLCYHEYRGAMVGVQALAIICVILLMLYGGNALTPAICTGGRDGALNPAQLERLQRRAVGLNVLVLLVGLSLLVAHAARPAPTTSGIIELTPQERARYDAAVNQGYRGRGNQVRFPASAAERSRRDCDSRPFDRRRNRARARVVLCQEAASRPGAGRKGFDRGARRHSLAIPGKDGAIGVESRDHPSRDGFVV